MIDIHNHILPNIDDGSSSMEETLNLLKEAKNAGFNKIIFTPHFKERFYEFEVKEKTEIFENVKEEVSKKDLDIELYLGNEVYMAHESMLDLLEENKISTIAGTRYLLFEFSMNSKPLNLFDVVDELRGNKIIPILAHPERYSYIQEKPEIVYDLIEKGVLMQQNYGSIIGQYGRKAKIIARNMLKTNSVHFLGSDVHRQNTVYKDVPQVLPQIEKIVGSEILTEITETNQNYVLENKRIDIYTPKKIKLSFKDKIEMSLK